MKQFSKKQRGKAASSRKSAKVSNGRPEAAISKMTKRVVAVSLVVPVATSAMLAVGFSPAQAATVSYFDNIATSGSVSATDPSGPNSLTLPIYYNTGTTSITRSDTAADNLLFSPTWVTNSYSEVVLTSPAVVPGSTSTFTITTSPPSSAPTSFGLTLAAGSNAGNISKSDYPLYHTAVPAGPVIVFGNPTGTYISTSTSPYTANLTFNGVNAVSGYTDIDGGNITINGGVTFAGTVQAGGIDINTESLVTFNSQLDLSPGADHSLRFHDAGNVSLNGGLTGNILYSGNNAIVSLSNGSISGNVGTSVAGTGTLIFGDGTLAQSVGGYIGSADGLTTIHEIRLDGMGGVTVGSSTNRVAADHINFNTATTLNLNGNLNTSSRSGRIDFNNLAGTLNIANGVTGYADVVSTGGTNGTVNFEESGALTGNIGTSTSSRISDVNIGTSAAGAVTMTGNLYATTLDISKGSALDITGNVTAATTLNYNSGSHATLRVTDGDVTGPVTTANNGFGILTLTGGSGANGTANTQVVSGTVGNSTNHLWIINAAATGMTSNFTNPAAIYANSFNVTGTGTANLSGGLEGSLSYLDDGTVNLATGKGITGTVSTSSNNYGILVLNGGTQSISGNIGSAALRLKEVDADASGATTTFGGDVNATTFNAAGASGSTVVNGATYATTVNVGAGTGTFKGLVTATTLNVTTGTANLDGGLTGNLDFDDNGFAVLAAGQTLTGNVTNSSATPRGTLTLSGSGTVTGSIGSATNAISTINAGADGTASQLNSAGGMTYASTLQFTGNGTVLLSGQNGGNAVGGLVGTVDFGTNVTSIGTLQIGDNVNLTTGASGIQFRDANGSTLRFLGTSTVAGNLGAAATGATLANSTLGSIYAGAAGETVTFNGDVHVAGSTFHVNAGTVNLNGDLYGPLVFDADGVAIVADGKSIKDDGTAALGTVSTATDNTGTLNYLGDTTLSHDLGTSANKLKAVSFHSDAAVAAVIQDIGQNVYAYTTTIGNATTATTANITATNLFLGDSLTLAASNVTLNTAGAVAVSGGSVVFDHAKNANGTLANLATVTKSTIGTGVMTTNGATMNFVVSSSPWNATNGGGIIDAATSSSITGEAGSSLVMTGTETVNLSLLGSLKNGQTLRMIDVAGGADTHIASTLNDNSYVIKTEFSRDGGDLVVWAVRDASTYIAQSGTSGHFSNNAASSLGALAASGTGYSEDMQTVLNKLDIDQWGYGNNAANLATQVERLAPIANASVSETTFNANTLALNTVEGRLAALRGDGKQVKPGKYSTWLKGFAGFIKQTAKEMYDGYRSSTTGSAIGADTRITDSLVGGLSLAYSDSEIKQDDFRVGDKTNAKAWQGSVYSSLDVTDRLYLEGTFAYADDQYKGQRRTAIDRTADSDFGGSQLTGRVAAGYRINLDSMQTLTPMVSMQWSRLNLDGYTETGADALNLKVDSQKLTSNRLGLGMRYGLETRSKGLTFRPEVSATWFNDSGDRNKAVVASYAGGGSSFATPVAGLEKHSYTIGAGLSVLTDNNSGVALNYDYTAASGAWAHDVQLVGRIAF